MLTLFFALTRRLWLSAVTIVPQQDPRQAVLDAVERGGDVEPLLENLIAVDPSRGRAARDATIKGDWELIWSARTDKFSPLLSLPKPLRPESTQILGDGVSNTLKRGVLGPTSLILSSGARVKDDATLEIFPPFLFEVELGTSRTVLVNADSDAEFRETQARTRAEQRAPRNLYAQLYLDTSGRPGDLRLSKVVAGDPVIVGATFLHRRIR